MVQLTRQRRRVHLRQRHEHGPADVGHAGGGSVYSIVTSMIQLTQQRVCLRQRHQHGPADAGHTSGVDGEQVPVPGYGDAGVAGDRQGVDVGASSHLHAKREVSGPYRR